MAALKFPGVMLALLLLVLPARAEERLTVVLVGDTGFNGPGARVSAAAGSSGGSL